MKKIFYAIISFLFSIPNMFPGFFGNWKNVNMYPETNILPDTWAAVDGLGRTLPANFEVKSKDDRKFVAMFYWTWHSLYVDNYPAKNVTEILKEHPEIVNDFHSPIWNDEPWYPNGRPYFWGEPIWGYYRSTDEYVLRKNAELLADAGVDVIFFDCTNGSNTFDNYCEKLFEVFEEAKKDGVNVPKVSYILPFMANENTTKSLKRLYENIYSKGRYKDLWFIWDDKPMLMAHNSQLNLEDETEAAISDFFTFRSPIGTYFLSQTFFNDKSWGWCSDYPQTKYGKSTLGKIEQMCVSVAQNAADGQLCAQNAVDKNVQGRSFTHGNFSYSYKYGGKKITVDKNIENSDFYGLNFQQQWDYAIKCNPDMIFITGWNEWIAGRHENWEGTENAFPDQFSDEYSRDIEPSNGRLKDHYYYQLVANIRRYKGISDSTIKENGKKVYYHYTNSTYKRDCDGWKGIHFNSDTMRNDFVKASVYDEKGNIYLTIETKDNITPYTDKAWMRVLLDTDTSGISSNWEGFEYIINRDNATANTVSIEKSVGGWNFEKVGDASYTVEKNKMTLVIPSSMIGLKKDNIHFNFKLSDNMQTDGDILDFYKSGDVAPGGRFTFVY